MRTLTLSEVSAVSGSAGVTDSEANQVIGKALGELWHGLTSTEGTIGMALGPGGMIAGVIIHYKLHH